MKTKPIILILIVLMMVFGAKTALAQPFLQAMINHNWISGEGFPADTQVQVQINGGAKGSINITTDGTGKLWAEGWKYWPGQWVARGDQIQATYDSQTVSMAVQNLTATVNVDANTIIGEAYTPVPDNQALAGRKVTVDILDFFGPGQQHFYHGETIVQPGGSFSFNELTASGFKLEKGHAIFMTLYDAPNGTNTGNLTSIAPYNGIPRLEVSPDQNWINGSEFPFNFPLILTIDPVNSGTNLTADLSTDSNGYFNKNVFEFNSYHLQPGDVVTVAYGVGQSISVTVPSVTVSVNVDTNIISGKAPGFQSIRIVIYSQDRSTLLHEATVGVDGSGNFSLTWPSLEPGMQIDLYLTDGNGQMLTYHPHNPIPSLTAMITHNWIRCEGFPPNTLGKLTIDQGAAGTIEIIGLTDANGNASANGSAWPGRNISMGNVIDVVIGSVRATMTIQDLHSAADAAVNLITGSAKTPSGQLLSGRRVDLSISQEWGQPELYHQSTTVGPDGNFGLNLNGSFDLQVGHKIFLELTDDPGGTTQGHRTCIAPFNDLKTIRASVTSNNYEDGSFKTSFDIYVWPDPEIVIDDIYIVGPGGKLPYSKKDFLGWGSDPTYFWLFTDGQPAIGTYTFHVISNGIDVTTQDTQNVNRSMPIPNFISPENGDLLTSSTPTVEWTAVSYPDITIYYRLVIDDLNGNRIYSSSRQAGMLSVTVPKGLLQAGQSYIMQIRVSDSNDWIATDNVGRGYCSIKIAARGDINGDGVIGLADGILSLKILAGYPVTFVSMVADVNGDEKIGLAEAIYVMQKVAGL
jgi:hypothetical protein